MYNNITLIGPSMKDSLKKTAALGSFLVGTSITAANCVSIGANAVAPYDNGRILTNSAVARLLRIDVAYDPKKDPNYNPSNSGQSYRNNLLTDASTYVRDPSDINHNKWHKPDTLKEQVAVAVGLNTVTGIGGIISVTAIAALTYLRLKRKKKINQLTDEYMANKFEG